MYLRTPTGNPAVRWFSESLNALLGIGRPSRLELQRLVLELMRMEWAASRNSAPPCGVCGVRTAGENPGDAPCTRCRNKRGIPGRTITLGEYETGFGRLVAQAKYSGWAAPFEVLGQALGVELLAIEMNDPRPPVLVPVPSPALRRWHRGNDHSVAIARGISAVTGWKVRCCLGRAWGAPQVGATRAARMRGGGGVRIRGWSARRSGIPAHVVLVDDVRTTGASLEKASRACRRGGAETVMAAVVAVRNGS